MTAGVGDDMFIVTGSGVLGEDGVRGVGDVHETSPKLQAPDNKDDEDADI